MYTDIYMIMNRKMKFTFLKENNFIVDFYYIKEINEIISGFVKF